MTKLKRPRRHKGDAPASPPLKHVAIIVEMGFSPAQEMLRGIADYVQEHEPWAIYLKPYGVDAPSNWFLDWHGHGIMVYAPGVRDEDMMACKVPIVDLTGHRATQHIPLVRLHDESIGRAGAEHLIERGFEHFAFYENNEFEWSRRRREGFVEVLNSHGLTCQVYSSQFATNRLGTPRFWEEQQQQLVEWLRQSLPKPAGIMASSDLMGQNLLEACQRAEIHVPEEVAVVGVDNDETICRIAWPPLSSVIANHSGRGYAAAQVLDQLIAGKPPPAGPVLIEPSGIAARASTDIMAIDDPAVVKTLRILRERAYGSIGVDEIVGSIAASRTVLQRKFRKAVGRSIHEEIVRLRLNRAIELLNDTTLEIKAIAKKSGFKSQAYMTTVFRDRLGRTPGSFRSYLPATGD